MRLENVRAWAGEYKGNHSPHAPVTATLNPYQYPDCLSDAEIDARVQEGVYLSRDRASEALIITLSSPGSPCQESTNVHNGGTSDRGRVLDQVLVKLSRHVDVIDRDGV